MARYITTKETAEVIALRAQGLSYRSIAAKTGLSKDTVQNLVYANRADIQEEHDELLKEIREAARVSYTATLEDLGNIHKKLSEAILALSFENIRLDKLIELDLKVIEKIGSLTCESEALDRDTERTDTLQSLCEF